MILAPQIAVLLTCPVTTSCKLLAHGADSLHPVRGLRLSEGRSENVWGGARRPRLASERGRLPAPANPEHDHGESTCGGAPALSAVSLSRFFPPGSLVPHAISVRPRSARAPRRKRERMRGVAADDWRMRECMAIGMEEGTWWTGAPASSGTAVAPPAWGSRGGESWRPGRDEAWATAPPPGSLRLPRGLARRGSLESKTFV